MALQAALKRCRVATSAVCCARLGASLMANANFIEHPFYHRIAQAQEVLPASPPSGFLCQAKQAASSGDSREERQPPRLRLMHEERGATQAARQPFVVAGLVALALLAL